MYIHTIYYFKELAHVIVGTGRSEICRADWHAGNLGSTLCYSPEAEFSGKPQLLLLRPSTD